MYIKFGLLHFVKYCCLLHTHVAWMIIQLTHCVEDNTVT